ncbi:MAG: DNA polymerase III subunit delta [Candidatus Nealsonbacteria bacterium CG_4_9_14_0_2_um_filter_37_38]|uniref:DNA polymerase III subunit delta n=1 Tax=Candidatus Nealsonbacteria bacterium CG_4_10_14_0_8_um_filter_37_14 TaxID=1974684 RepID=A0A2M7R707_9BACT|nr:MAG: DNA polymerase III subunit delta [Candidatus Nealsonbacteria bacterium CG11_big_fil_rev_8_21_14_0_20_37_68]PIW91900.1 MAG: DNA polymerase III subunit delta [Candidatus Nealsonbacteria bacterium CG_4_8_14_3_um_filter_37_23]PIY89569.1 MAG: DNA polymerase III subunit delta [Candidatus Nealsonbacteria bacterium CG_4_10_14_0_8_um_filter_37_14]PJC51489.1 MAG: DNA polymerase III subunit delta [Candidatus Nealsonbacteria bacterium CG_4_9_14_0_2_um_filter_37_38]
MLIFLYGQDTYRSRQKLNEIIERYKKIHKSGLNLKYYDAKKTNFQDFKNEVQSSPMFKEKKLMILENVFLNYELKTSFLKDARKFIDLKDVILFYQDQPISQNDPLFIFLKKYAKTQEFKLLAGIKLKNWVKREFERCQTKADPLAIEKLINFVGNDLWQFSNEIKKLVSYKSKNKNSKVLSEDVELLVKPKIETDIFKTIEAIAQKNKAKALSLVYKHLERGDNSLYLLHMINFQFRNLLMAKDLIEKDKSYNAVLKESGFHPYVFKKIYWQAKKFSLWELKKIYQKIFQIDLKIKTGQLNPGIALDLLIAGI